MTDPAESLREACRFQAQVCAVGGSPTWAAVIEAAVADLGAMTPGPLGAVLLAQQPQIQNGTVETRQVARLGQLSTDIAAIAKTATAPKRLHSRFSAVNSPRRNTSPGCVAKSNSRAACATRTSAASSISSSMAASFS